MRRIVPLILTFALGAVLTLGQGSAQRTRKTDSKQQATVTVSGEVRPNLYVQVRSEIPGRVQKIYFEPGSDVKKGEALVLIERQSSEPKNLTQYSPLDGVIADISVRAGEAVTGDPSTPPLMTIADMSRIEVEVYVEEPDISKIAVGQSARIIVDAFHENRIRSVVIRKDTVPVAQSDAKEFKVTLEMRDVPKAIRSRLRPGMSATAIITTSTTLPLRAGSSCKKQSIQDLVNALAHSFEEKNMSLLDVDRPYLGTIRIVIEHSLAEDNDPQRFIVRRFSSFARAERWFKSKEIEGLPGRNAMPLVKCAKGVCTYNFDGGILHNNLYLKKITYGMRGGCPHIKTIYLVDGD